MQPVIPRNKMIAPDERPSHRCSFPTNFFKVICYAIKFFLCLAFAYLLSFVVSLTSGFISMLTKEQNPALLRSGTGAQVSDTTKAS